MIINNQINKIISVLVLFCLFIQPMQVASITANAATNDVVLSLSEGLDDVTLNLADGLITITNRDYVQKSSSGTVLKSGTVAASGRLVLIGVQSNSWNVAVNGNNVPVIRYKNVTTNGIITGAITGDLTIEIEGACNFNNGTALTNASVTGILKVTGINGTNSVNTLSLIVSCDTVINNLRGNIATWKGLSISSTKNLSLYNCSFPSVSGYSSRIGNTSSNTYLVTIKDSNIGNILLQHAGNILVDNLTATFDGSTSGIAIIAGNVNSGDSLQILNSNIKVQYCTFNGPTTKVINTKLETTYPNYQGNIAFYGNNIIKGSTLISPYTSGKSVHVTQTKTSVNDIVLEDSAAILAGTVSSRTRFSGSSGVVDPINTSSEKLYLNKLLIPGANNSKVNLSIDERDPVNLWTDEDGYLNLYLSVGAHNIKVIGFNDVDYSLEFSGATSRESSAASNIIGTLVPTTPQTTITFGQYINKNFEYSFDYTTWKNATTDNYGHFKIVFPNGKSRIHIRIEGKLYYADNSESTIVIIAAKPLIKNQSEGEVTILKGKTGTIYVNTEPFHASGKLNYTWYKNGIHISGESSNTLTITNASASANGAYTCEVSESGMENSISTPITITVTEGQTVPELKIIDQSGDKTVIKGYSTELYVLAQPETAIYEWYKDNELINGISTRRITVVGTVTGSAIYTCVLKAENGTVVSQPMTVNTIDNPLESELADLQGIKKDLESQIINLTEQLTSLQAGKTHLEDHIVLLNNQIAGLYSQISTLQGQLLQAQEELQTVGADKVYLTGQIQILNNHIISLQVTIDTLSIDLQEATNQKIILVQQISDLNIQVNTLENQIIILVQTVSQKEAENTDLKNQIIILLGQASDLHVEVTNLQNEVTVLTEQNNILISQVQQLQLDKQALDALVTNLQQQLLDANSAIESLTNQVNSLIAQLTAVTAEKSAIETNVTELNIQIVNLNTEITILQVTLNNLQAQLDLSGEDMENLLQQILNLNNQVNTLNQIITQKQEQIDQLTQENNLLQGKVDTLVSQVDSLQNQVILLQGNVTDKEVQITALLIDIDTLQGNFSNLQNDLKNLQQVKENIELQLNTTITMMSNLKDILLSIKVELGVTDDSEILPAIRNLKAQLTQLSDTNVLLTNQIIIINQQLTEAQQSNIAMQQKLEELIVLLETDNQEDIKLKIVELQTALVNSQRQILELSQEKSDLTQQLKDASTLINNLQKQIEDLLAVSGEDTAELLNQIKELNNQINILVSQNSAMQTLFKDLSEKVVELNKEKITYQSEVVRLQTLLETANTSLSEVREQLADAQAENSILKSEIDNLKKVIEELNKQLYACGESKPNIPQPQTPQPSDSQNNTEVKNQLEQALTELQEAKTELAKAQKQLEAEKQKNVNAVPVPENAVVVVPAETLDTIPPAIREMTSNNGSEKLITAEYITAEKGWEIATNLKSKWQDKIKISDMTGTASKLEQSKISLYAREKSNPQRVYEYMVNIEKPITIPTTPNFTMSKLLYLGSAFKLNLSEMPRGAKVTFNSSNKKIATINKDGKITVIKEGKAIITGSVTGIKNPYKFTINVTVKKDNHKTLNLKEEIIQTSADIPVLVVYKLVAKGKNTKLTLTGADNAAVTYISSDSNIVTVNLDGTMKGINKGYATVAAILSQDGAIYSCIIRVRVTDGTVDTNMWNYLTVA